MCCLWRPYKKTLLLKVWLKGKHFFSILSLIFLKIVWFITLWQICLKIIYFFTESGLSKDKKVLLIQSFWLNLVKKDQEKRSHLPKFLYIWSVPAKFGKEGPWKTCSHLLKVLLVWSFSDKFGKEGPRKTFPLGKN